MMTPKDCANFNSFTATTPTNVAIQRDLFKDIMDKSKWNSKSVQLNHRRQETENRELEKQNKQKTKQKIKGRLVPQYTHNYIKCKWSKDIN